jgi:hypothetical protein
MPDFNRIRFEILETAAESSRAGCAGEQLGRIESFK